MSLQKIVLAGVCLLIASIAPPSHAQGGCSSGQDAAVQCFVSNAVRTNLVTLQYGMTMSQFKAYGVSVSKIVQQQPTALALVGLSSAVADALPPTNADGSANQAAQTAAIWTIFFSPPPSFTRALSECSTASPTSVTARGAATIQAWPRLPSTTPAARLGRLIMMGSPAPSPSKYDFSAWRSRFISVATSADRLVRISAGHSSRIT